MNKNEIRNMLYDYVQGKLSSDNQLIVEQELSQSADLQAELERIQTYYAKLDSLEPVQIPDQFLSKVHERIELATNKSIWQKLLYPLHIKIPVELTGIIATLVLVFFYLIPKMNLQDKTPLSDSYKETIPHLPLSDSPMENKSVHKIDNGPENAGVQKEKEQNTNVNEFVMQKHVTRKSALPKYPIVNNSIDTSHQKYTSKDKVNEIAKMAGVSPSKGGASAMSPPSIQSVDPNVASSKLTGGTLSVNNFAGTASQAEPSVFPSIAVAPISNIPEPVIQSGENERSNKQRELMKRVEELEKAKTNLSQKKSAPTFEEAYPSMRSIGASQSVEGEKSASSENGHYEKKEMSNPLQEEYIGYDQHKSDAHSAGPQLIIEWTLEVTSTGTGGGADSVLVGTDSTLKNSGVIKTDRQSRSERKNVKSAVSFIIEYFKRYNLSYLVLDSESMVKSYSVNVSNLQAQSFISELKKQGKITFIGTFPQGLSEDTITIYLKVFDK
jgi:hypothetical protein